MKYLIYAIAMLCTSAHAQVWDEIRDAQLIQDHQHMGTIDANMAKGINGTWASTDFPGKTFGTSYEACMAVIKGRFPSQQGNYYPGIHDPVSGASSWQGGFNATLETMDTETQLICFGWRGWPDTPYAGWKNAHGAIYIQPRDPAKCDQIPFNKAWETTIAGWPNCSLAILFDVDGDHRHDYAHPACDGPWSFDHVYETIDPDGMPRTNFKVEQHNIDAVVGGDTSVVSWEIRPMMWRGHWEDVKQGCIRWVQ